VQRHNLPEEHLLRDLIYNEGYAGTIGWAWHDTAGNWSSFQPVFTAWGSAHSAIVGPR
jgi:hypothetical protein